MESFGEYIRNQRELRQITHDEISSVTKVSLKYLDALENDRKEALPSRPFVVGFLRVYAKYLGLDDDAVVTRYIEYNDQNAVEEPSKVDFKKKRRLAKILLTTSFALMVVIFSLLVLTFM